MTEGDKVQAQIDYGRDVGYYPVGDLCQEVSAVTDSEVDSRYDKITQLYTPATDDIGSVKYQLRLEIALRRFLLNFSHVSENVFFNAISIISNPKP